MTTQSVPISSDGQEPAMEVDADDASSAATPPIGYRNSSEDQTFISKTIRFFFAPFDQSRIDHVHPSEVHTQWIRTIQAAFGEDIKIINNFNRPVKNLGPSETINRAFSYAQQFKVHSKTIGKIPTTGAPKISNVIVHRILTRVPLGQIKRHPSVYQLLQDNQCYLNEHLWDEHEWDVQQIGFITGFNPKYYTSDRVTTMFRTSLSKALPKAKIPKFQMVVKSHRINHNDRHSTTKAYTIELPSHTVPQMIPILKETTRDTKEFVPFQMRSRNPEAFQGAIRYQNHMLAAQEVIVIDNVGKDAMYYLSDRIQVITGVLDVTPTRKVEETGRYLVIVNKEYTNRVREKLLKKFAFWLEDAVPDDARPSPEQYNGPPTVRPSRHDGYSEGDASWMTNSTKSFLTFSVTSMKSTGASADELSLDRAWDIPKESSTINNTRNDHMSGLSTRKPESYAAAVAPGSDQMSGITDSEPSPRDARHEELSLKIASLEAMIVTLCAQVQALTTQQAQPITTPPQHPRDISKQQEKRQDIKMTPRKSKRSNDFTADSEAAEGSQQSATQPEDRPTVWDDYLTTQQND